MVAVALGALALRSQKSASVVAEGWKRLRPGWLIHWTLGGCIAFVSAVAYFFAAGGSSRADADGETVAALCLLLGFGTGAGWILWLAYLRKFEWRGSEMRIIRPLGEPLIFRFSDVVDVSEGMDGSEYRLKMANGKTVHVNLYMHGCNDFLDDLGAYFDKRDRP